MLADLDLLLTVVYCMTDDFLPPRADNARRAVSDAEIVTLAIAQAIMGIPSDHRFILVADRRLRHVFPVLPSRDAFHKRRIRLCGQIEALIAHFARHSPGHMDNLLLVDSTPIECARSRETVKRGGSSSLADALANAADYGYCASHSRLGAVKERGTNRQVRRHAPRRARGVSHDVLTGPAARWVAGGGSDCWRRTGREVSVTA